MGGVQRDAGASILCDLGEGRHGWNWVCGVVRRGESTLLLSERECGGGGPINR